MTSCLVDTNVIIDILGGEGLKSWSLFAMKVCAKEGELVINPVIWAELAVSFGSETALEAAFSGMPMVRLPLPFEAGYPAGEAHAAYRRAGGQRDRTLPDFLIGGHAAVSGMTLLTRDPRRYQSSFPSIRLVTPQTLPLPELRT